jgi:hypothetical protein
MGDTWFTGFSDELARCLTDAENCAETCERYLALIARDEHDMQQIVDVLAAPAAVARVLIELIDHPPQLVLAAVRLCRDLAAEAAGAVGVPAEVAASLRTLAVSAADLLEAAG